MYRFLGNTVALTMNLNFSFNDGFRITSGYSPGPVIAPQFAFRLQLGTFL